MRKQFILLLIVCGMMTSIISGCKKDNNNNNNGNADEDTTAIEDNAFAEHIYSDAFTLADEAIRSQPGFNKTSAEAIILSGCDTVIVDTTSSLGIKKLTIDFGTGCVGRDGKTRSGKIIVSLSGRYRTQGTVITITFDNYVVNGYQVEGTKTVTNKGRNSKGNIEFVIKVVNAKITGALGALSWESTRLREWVAGENTINPFDDVYELTGEASGTNRKGKSFTVKITKPLRIMINCRYVTSGTLELTPENLPVRTFDYGNGTCDKNATVTVSGKTYNITLRD